jgi:hypothetical protein
MYYEHRAGAPARALELTREALSALRTAWRRGSIPPGAYSRLRARLGRRLERLESGGSPRSSGAGLFASGAPARASKRNPVSSAPSSAKSG